MANKHLKRYLIYFVIAHAKSLCNPTDCSPPGFSVRGDSLGKNTAVGSLSLLQGICPTKGWNPGLLHCRQILYHLSHQGCPKFSYTSENVK